MADGLMLAWHQFRLERRMFWRNPTSAFFNIALPLVFLALFGTIFRGDREVLDRLVPGIAGMAITATTFNALAMNLTILRDQGVLKRVRGTPIPEWAYLAALIASAVVNAFMQVAIVVVAGRLFFGTGWPPNPAELVVIVTAGVVCLASLGIAFAHLIPDADSASAYTNAVFLPALVISGAFFDQAHTPEFLRSIASALPLAHLIDALQGAMVTGRPLRDLGSGMAIVGLWALAGIWFAVRGFEWESRRG